MTHLQVELWCQLEDRPEVITATPQVDQKNPGGLSLSDESFPNEGARGAFAKPSRSVS